jgi:hypothetical protein
MFFFRTIRWTKLPSRSWPERGADVNARDGIWYQTPLSLSLGKSIGDNNNEVIKRLLKAGAKDVDAAAPRVPLFGNVATFGWAGQKRSSIPHREPAGCAGGGEGFSTP